MAGTKLEGKLTRKQRVEIAKDVIALCKSRQRKIRIDTGAYFSFDEWRKEDALLAKGGQLTSRRLPSCQVCARGALFIKSVDLLDKCDLSKLSSGHVSISDAAIERSRKEWGDEQTHLIESHFECGPSWLPEDPKKRLLAIMENIVANNGEYVPSRKEA